MSSSSTSARERMMSSSLPPIPMSSTFPSGRTTREYPGRKAESTGVQTEGTRGPGSAAVCPELQWCLDGCDRADSFIVNPHKWLFVPIDASALYTPHQDLFRRTFSLVPEYLSTPLQGRVVEVLSIYRNWFLIRWPPGDVQGTFGWVPGRWVGVVSPPPPDIITPSP